MKPRCLELPGHLGTRGKRSRIFEKPGPGPNNTMSQNEATTPHPQLLPSNRSCCKRRLFPHHGSLFHWTLRRLPPKAPEQILGANKNHRNPTAPGASDGKDSICNAREPGSIPGTGRSPGGGNGHPLQHSCLENPMDRGAWRAAVPGVAQSRPRLSAHTHSYRQ